jgi:GrpB-like predicted nucleotidyltransferase (UPF0157 family)
VLVGFRDYLRNHAARAREYQELKHRLAHDHAPALSAYTLAKATFISQTLKLAFEAGTPT